MTSKPGPEKEYEKRLEVRLERDLLARLRRKAKALGITVSELVREAARREAA